MKILQQVRSQLGKPYFDLEYLLLCLKEMLAETGEMELSHSVPWLSPVPSLEKLQTEKYLHLFSLSFQLLNIVEVNGAVQSRRHKEDNESEAAINGLWASKLLELKNAGYTEDQLLEKISQIHVEPVLTAHPTESKPQLMLMHLRRLYLLMVKRENQMFTRREQDEIRLEIKLNLHRLWRIGEIFTEKPEVESELDNVIHYLTNVFPEVIDLHDKQFIQAWKFSGFNSDKLLERHAFPGITFGNWVGGDRDGHPLVTAEITRETLEKLRLNAFLVVRRELVSLVSNIGFNITYDQAGEGLKEKINELLAQMGHAGEDIMLQNKGEVYVQYINLLAAKLPLNVKREHAVEIYETPYSYKHPTELLNDLRLLKSSLETYGAKQIASLDLLRPIRIVEAMGFHLAHLDIRQNSHFHEKAFVQLLNQASQNGDYFLTLSEKEKLDFLNHELELNRPFSHFNTHLPHEADAVISCYRVVENYISHYSANGIGAFIVSMTRSVNDLLIVYLLAREAGLTEFTDNGLVCKMEVVPLLETIDDLLKGSKIIDEFFSHPVTQNSLAYQQNLKKSKQLSQQIMIGYSDSNKDGGILASQWYLYDSQAKMIKTAKKHGVKIQFFHGKGGSISRGAGPTHWFLKALPPHSVSGDIRITEQGEVIERKYANKLNAAYNMELLTAGTTCRTLLDEKVADEHSNLEGILHYLACESLKFYGNLTHNPGFIQFYSQATPIDAIESSKIGSRPSRRSGKRSLEDLRAIPWVFSWSQIRFNITSWYGVGYALLKMKEMESEKFDQLKILLKSNSFLRYVFTNIESSLSATDEQVMLAYSELVEDESVKIEIRNLLLKEFERTKQMLEEIIENPIEERRKNHYFSTILRAEALDPMHYTQIELLKEWRKSIHDDKNTELILSKILRNINAIAGAIGYTG